MLARGLNASRPMTPSGPGPVVSGLRKQSGYGGREKGHGVPCHLRSTSSLYTLGDMVSLLPSNLVGQDL